MRTKRKNREPVITDEQDGDRITPDGRAGLIIDDLERQWKKGKHVLTNEQDEGLITSKRSESNTSR